MKYHIIIFTLSILHYYANGQVVDREEFKMISKAEFSELKEIKGKFIPDDLGTNGLIIICYTKEELDSLLIKGINASLRLTGSNYAEREYVINEVITDKKLNLNFLNKDRRKLRKYSKQVVMSTTVNLPKYMAKDYRYELRIKVVTDIKNIGKRDWYVSYLPYFYDRVTKHFYDVFMPVNYDYYDLMN